MTKPLASLSLDLDNKWSYLKTHGDPGWESFPSYLDVVVPRVLDLLDELGPADHLLRRRPGRRPATRTAPRSRRSPPPGTRSATTRSTTSRGCTSIRRSRSTTSSPRPRTPSKRRPACGPTGFRGPGYSLSPAVLRVPGPPRLPVRRLDASHVPRPAGPGVLLLHRPAQPPSRRSERKQLFGKLARRLPAAPAVLVAARARRDGTGIGCWRFPSRRCRSSACRST